MNKNYKKTSRVVIIIAVIVNIIVTGSVLYFGKEYIQNNNKNQALDVTRVAILTPVTHQSLEQIEKGFRDTLEKSSKKRYEFKTYNANGNRTLMNAQALEISSNDFDLVFTIGAGTTQVMGEVANKKQKDIHIVFGAVADALAKTLDPKKVTGVIEKVDYNVQLDLLLKLRPDVKRLLLVYDPGQNGGLEQDKKTIEKLAHEKNIICKSLEIYNTNEIYAKTTTACHDTDVLMILKDNTVVSGIDSLVKICTRDHVTLLVTDLDSVEKGAALGFGVHEYDFGVQAAEKAQKIIEENKTVTQVPMSPITNFKIKVNSKTAGHQGLVLDDKLLFMMKSGEVI